MNEIKYTKEATYVFEYNGDKLVQHHYRDNLLGLRHYIGEFDSPNDSFRRLNVKGTFKPHETIKPPLIGERVYYQDDYGGLHAELFFLLPDINRYMILGYGIGNGYYEPTWMITSTTELYSLEN